MSSTGLITAKKKGTAKITVKYGSKKVTLKVKVVKASGYTISKKSQTASSALKVKVKAKKGYTVYYSFSKKLASSKKIKSNKTKTFTISNTKTLIVYAVKNGTKVTNSSLKKALTAKKGANYYTYTIQTADSGTSSTSSTSSTSTDTSSSTSTGTNTTDTNTGTDQSTSGYVESTSYTLTEEDTNTSAEGATQITLGEAPSSKQVITDGDGSEIAKISKKNKLTIEVPGTYEITTNGAESSALVEVDIDDTLTTTAGSVHIILNGVTLTAEASGELDTEDEVIYEADDEGVIKVKSSDLLTQVIITAVDKTTNTITNTGSVVSTSATTDGSTEYGYPVGILCKKTPCIINGSGTIHIVCAKGKAIKCTDALNIIHTTIVAGNSTTPIGDNGISAKTDMVLYNANLTVYSVEDAVKITLDENDVAEDSTLADLGNMTIDGGVYTLVSTTGDGISAYRTLYLNPGTLTATTLNANSTTGDEGSYKCIKAGLSITVPESAGTINADSTKTSKSTIQNVGWGMQAEGNNDYADDTLHCDGYIVIKGGTLNLASGDDGIHADKGVNISAGKINITASYEGIEGIFVTVTGGEIDVVASDDGFNVSDGGTTSTGDTTWVDGTLGTDYELRITGGDIYVNAEGDGLDSNGNIYITGGKTVVDGPTNGGNGALDYGDVNCKCVVNGGTLIASGSAGMVAAPTASSQPVLNITFNSSLSANTTVTVKDSTGNTVISATPSKSFQNIILSDSSLKSGSYSIYYGSTLFQTVNVSSTGVTSVGSSQGGGPGQGGFGR